MTTRYTFMDSPVGKLWIAWSERGLVSVGFHRQDRGAQIQENWEYDEDLKCEAIDQLSAYFDGNLKEFDLPLVLSGTEFQKRVWQELAKIPFGQTITYGELAARVGNPKAARAVGAANGQNPIAIVLPCHRVIGRDGKLTGYAGGVDIKEYLLRLECEPAKPGRLTG